MILTGLYFICSGSTLQSGGSSSGSSGSRPSWICTDTTLASTFTRGERTDLKQKQKNKDYHSVVES